MKMERKLRREKEEDITEFMNHYLVDSHKTISKIKEHVYSFIDISISPNPSKKTFPTVPSIISACKQNMDDLKRIESVLKGYIQSKRQTPKQGIELNKQDKLSIQTSTSPSDYKAISNSQGHNYIQEILEIKAENFDYIEEIKKLKQEIKLLKQNQIQNQHIYRSPPQLHKNDDKHIESTQSSQRKMTLKQCKSDLFESNQGIELIRKRNRECLDVVRLLKQELDIIDDQE